ncbi:hypothetical protein RHO15_05075 [Utexia brackfieldae]|uniref:hypothetical protein n=1 Tax=Utexia brackfieldae TaxID=3074108 RepID=UPI00370D2173
MNNFRIKLNNHADYVQKVDTHYSTEATTKQILILPLLDILGFSSYEPTNGKAEYKAGYLID